MAIGPDIMKIWTFARQIADLALSADEDSKDWIKVVPLRRSWYWLLGLVTASAIIGFIGTQFAVFASSELAALILRSLLIATLFGAIAANFAMCWLFYKYVLKRTVDLALSNVFFFYLVATMSFAACYNQLYRFNPSLFSYNQPSTMTTVLWTVPPLRYQIQRLHFVLFSALQSVNGGYYQIASHSVIVSLMGYVQGIFTICLLALLVAAYVNRTSQFR
jgi:hypothetical protein